jgi:uncharacterized membrane protein
MSESSPQRETARIEAFSDGVFAIAITLLAFELKVPRIDGPTTAAALGLALLGQWPSYFAFLSSFATILIMWVSHHNMFRLLSRTDNGFLFINGLLLMLITAVPFPTALLGAHLLDQAGSLACAIYAGCFFLIAVAFQAVWIYVARNGLLQMRGRAGPLSALNRRYFFGPLAYLLALGLAFVNEYVALAICFLMALFYAALSYDQIYDQR